MVENLQSILISNKSQFQLLKSDGWEDQLMKGSQNLGMFFWVLHGPTV